MSDSPSERQMMLDTAEEVTRMLLETMARTVPHGTKLATFNCSTLDIDSDLTRRWIRAAGSAGFLVWPDVSQELERQERRGTVVRTQDGAHWAAPGHHIVAAALMKKIDNTLSLH